MWRRLTRRRTGSAAVEFALVTPLLLVMCGGLADFGIMLGFRHRLASGVAQGAGYAFNTGANVSAAAVQGVVQATASLPSAAVGVTGPACYCVSGTPAALAALACTNPCPDGTAPGKYVLISGSYSYRSIMPYFSALTSLTIQQSATVRVQ
jgi:Flp pilus assembly protein TadG